MSPVAWTKEPGPTEAEVLMIRQVHRGSVLIIEGIDDYRFWMPRAATSPTCDLVVGHGKPGVEKVLIRLDQRGFAGALGIVDDDFDRPHARPLPSANLLATDAHDLECLLLCSPALDRVLAEYADPVRVRRFEHDHQTTVREALFARGLSFGRLRWLAHRTAWPGGSIGYGRHLVSSKRQLSKSIKAPSMTSPSRVAWPRVALTSKTQLLIYQTPIPGRSARVTT